MLKINTLTYFFLVRLENKGKERGGIYETINTLWNK